ncbi:MAG TPA: response regulator transcription factor [Solirubrobacteraceae bacterium]|jgi:DNA-binding NarL/FixJ family response regulator|nr:response regulator transcription factor [Solirubrobacteraceae bacterium]
MIADDTYLIREALEQIMRDSDAIDVVGTYGDRDTLLEAIDAAPPDAVITDIRMPPTGTDEGIQIARLLRERHPRTGVVVLTQFADPSYVVALLESGSSGRAYLLKERISAPAQLLSAVETVVAGGSVVDPKVVEVLVQARTIGPSSPLAALSPREHEVLAQLAEGKSNTAIAEALVLTRRAVEKHINSIFSKLELPGPEDVSRRVTAALMFLSAGEPPPAQ